MGRSRDTTLVRKARWKWLGSKAQAKTVSPSRVTTSRSRLGFLVEDPLTAAQTVVHVVHPAFFKNAIRPGHGARLELGSNTIAE